MPPHRDARSYPLGASPPHTESISNCLPVRARAHDSGCGAGSVARAGVVSLACCYTQYLGPVMQPGVETPFLGGGKCYRWDTRARAREPDTRAWPPVGRSMPSPSGTVSAYDHGDAGSKSAIASRAREAIDLFSFPDSSSNDLRW